MAAAINPGVEVEWLILADAAQVHNGKLFLLGGGWDTLIINGPLPRKQKLAIAASFRVPWHETNIGHDFEIVIMSDDDHQEHFKVAGRFEVGRPAGIPQGQDQRAPFAAEADIDLDAGAYDVIARIDGRDERRVAFRVVSGAGASARQR